MILFILLMKKEENSNQLINLKHTPMTTTQKLLLHKAQINQKTNKAMTFIIVATIIIFTLACIMAYNSFGLQVLL